VWAHYLCDYPLQGAFLSEAKNRFSSKIPYPWHEAMTAHAVIHGGAVALLTGVWWLAFPEIIIHFITDDRKCAGKIDIYTDQSIHIGCKLLWWAIACLIYSH
jgi:hypothetical protein